VNSAYHPFSFPHDLFDFADTLAQNHGVQKFHIVILDHGDHTSFKDDVEALIKAGALAPGAKIIADNAYTKSTQKSDYFRFVDESGHFKASETIPITHPYKDALHVATFNNKRDEL
jgi:predicted O-methyltransferase YrrM